MLIFHINWYSHKVNHMDNDVRTKTNGYSKDHEKKLYRTTPLQDGSGSSDAGPKGGRGQNVTTTTTHQQTLRKAPVCFLCGAEGHKKFQCKRNNSSGRQEKNNAAIGEQFGNLVAQEAGTRDANAEFRRENSDLRSEIESLKKLGNDHAAKDADKARKEQERRTSCGNHIERFRDSFDGMVTSEKVMPSSYWLTYLGTIVWILFFVICASNIYIDEDIWTILAQISFFGFFLVYIFLFVYIYVVLIVVGFGFYRNKNSVLVGWLRRVPLVLPLRHEGRLVRRFKIFDLDSQMELKPDARLNSISHVEMKNPEGRGSFRLVTQRHTVIKAVFLRWSWVIHEKWDNLCDEEIREYGYPEEETWNFSMGLLAELSTPSILGTDSDYESFKHRCQYKMNSESTIGINKYMASIDNVYQGTFILAAHLWRLNQKKFAQSGF